MAEFDLIEHIRARTRHARGDVLLGIGDDAALLQPAPGMQLVACTDTLNVGVHFPEHTAPAALGWKALAVNLSDLAAMGAEPAWALLALSLPAPDTAFVAELAAGFAQLAARHEVALIGGDTTRGPLSLTVTALGQIPPGAALLRSGARVGDAVLVTGTLGDAAAGLALAQGKLSGVVAADEAFLRRRLDQPEPRVAAGLALRGLATACIDISDGLLADLGHVCTASGVGAEIELGALPLSAALSATMAYAQAQALALSGGDEYELCFCVAPAQVEAALARVQAAGCMARVIGRIVATPGVRVIDAQQGRGFEPTRRGYEHFA